MDCYSTSSYVAILMILPYALLTVQLSRAIARLLNQTFKVQWLNWLDFIRLLELMKTWRPFNNALFDTFCIQISQKVKPRWVYEDTRKFDDRLDFASKASKWRFPWSLQRLNVARILYPFGYKRCQIKRF